MTEIVSGRLILSDGELRGRLTVEDGRIASIEPDAAATTDVIVVPDIKTGNAMFKMMVYFQSACAAGIVMGAKVPAILTSRADPPEARLAAAAIAAILAQQR